MSLTASSATPHIAMLSVVLAYASSNVLMKVASAGGLNRFVFVSYGQIIAALVLCPFAYLLERKVRPALTLRIATKIFFLSLVGTTIHLNLYYTGLEYTTPTVATALSNLIPAATFVIAVILGIETVKLKTLRGRAKVVGTLVSIVGSLTFALWKGKCLVNGNAKRPLIDIYGSDATESKHLKESWLKGSALVLLSDFTWGTYLILQGIVYKDYPAQLSLNCLVCLFSAVHSTILALFFARDLSQWRLGWNTRLWIIIYCGVVIAAAINSLQILAISRKGPVFAAMYSPLLAVIVGIFSAIVFAEKLYLGSLIGAFIIILGLYCVLWGKSKENEMVEDPGNEKGSTEAKAFSASMNTK